MRRSDGMALTPSRSGTGDSIYTIYQPRPICITQTRRLYPQPSQWNYQSAKSTRASAPTVCHTFQNKASLSKFFLHNNNMKPNSRTSKCRHIPFPTQQHCYTKGNQYQQISKKTLGSQFCPSNKALVVQSTAHGTYLFLVEYLLQSNVNPPKLIKKYLNFYNYFISFQYGKQKIFSSSYLYHFGKVN